MEPTPPPDLKRLVRFAAAPPLPADAPDIPTFIGSTVVAKMIGISPDTLRRWRKRGVGPRPMRIGIRLFYTEDAVKAWMKERSDAGYDLPVDDH